MTIAANIAVRVAAVRRKLRARMTDSRGSYAGTQGIQAKNRLDRHAFRPAISLAVDKSVVW